MHIEIVDDRMAIEVVSLTEADIPGTVEVIQQAFADDPYFNWVFDKSSVCVNIYLVLWFKRCPY